MANPTTDRQQAVPESLAVPGEPRDGVYNSLYQLYLSQGKTEDEAHRLAQINTERTALYFGEGWAF